MSDADAWSEACEEDLAAEKARRRAEHGRESTDPAEELRRLADAVTEGIDRFSGLLGGFAASAGAQGAAKQFVQQAKAAAEPVVERNPQVFDHLAAAGGELLAAYRAAVGGSGPTERADFGSDPADPRHDPRDDAGPGADGRREG